MSTNQINWSAEFQNVRTEMTEVMNNGGKLSGAKLMMLCAKLLSIISNHDNSQIEDQSKLVDHLAELQDEINNVKNAFGNIKSEEDVKTFQTAITDAINKATALRDDKKDPAFKSESAQKALNNYISDLSNIWDGKTGEATPKNLEPLYSNDINQDSKTAAIQSITQNLSTAESQISGQSAAVNSIISGLTTDINQTFSIIQSIFSNRTELAKKILSQPA